MPSQTRKPQNFASLAELNWFAIRQFRNEANVKTANQLEGFLFL